MSTMKEMKTQASWEASVTGLCNRKLNYISLPYECSGGTLTQFGDAPLRLLSCFERGRELIKPVNSIGHEEEHVNISGGFCKCDYAFIVWKHLQLIMKKSTPV